MCADCKDCRFPLLCPVCDRDTGTPFSTTCDAEEIEVFVRCIACWHVWKVSFKSPPLFDTPVTSDIRPKL